MIKWTKPRDGLRCLWNGKQALRWSMADTYLSSSRIVGKYKYELRTLGRNSSHYVTAKDGRNLIIK